jgi:maleate isomerase
MVPVGVIVPFDFELDWEYWRYLPRNVELYFTRTPVVRKPVGVTLAKEVSRANTVWRATQALLSVEPEVILYACSSGSFVRGLAGEESVRRTMLEAGAKRAITTSGAMLEAFHTAGVQRVALATPYTERLTRQLAAFVEEAGIEVVSMSYLGIDRNITNVSHETIHDLVVEANHPDADAVFVSCTALRTFGIVTRLESEIGRPVFTSNQVSLWGALCAASAMYRDGDEVAPMEQLGGATPTALSTEILLRHAERVQAALTESSAQPPELQQQLEEIVVS